MWQTKYAAAIPKNLGVGVNFRPSSEGYFLSGRPQSVDMRIKLETSDNFSTFIKNQKVQEMITYLCGIDGIESLSSGMQLYSSLQSKSRTLCTCLQHYLSRGSIKGQTAIGYLIDYYSVVFLELRGIEIGARPKPVFFPWN